MSAHRVVASLPVLAIAGCCTPFTPSAPSAPAPSDAVPVAALASDLGSRDSLVEWEPYDRALTPLEPVDRPCTEVEQAAAAALGKVQSCRAAGAGPRTLVFADVGEPQDCPAGCFFDRAAGVFDGATLAPAGGGAASWLQRSAEEVLYTLYVPTRIDPDRVRVSCAARRGFTADVSAPGRLAVLRFDGTDGCLLFDDLPPDGDATFGVVVELALTGAVWLRDDGTLDASELRVAHPRLQATEWTAVEQDRGHRGPTVSRRRVLAEATSSAAPAAPCALDPSLGMTISGAVGERCGNPVRKLTSAWMLLVARGDGAFEAPALHVAEPFDPAWRACAEQTVAELRATATPCPSRPVIASMWSIEGAMSDRARGR